MRIFTLAASLLFLLSISRFASAQTSRPEHIPTNDDVLLMVRFHASESKILDAIHSSTKTNFDTTPDAISKLASAGTSANVIAAMMKKQSEQGQQATDASAQTPSPSPQAPPSAYTRSIGAMIPPAVALHTSTGDTELSPRRGQYDMTGMGARFLGLTFLQYPGAAAKFRTSERRPYLLVHTDNDPHDKQESSYSFLVKLDPSTSHDERALKIGHAFGNRSTTELANPDKDWVIEYDSSQESPGVWRITPRAELKPGEYGLYTGRFTLYDFGID